MYCPRCGHQPVSDELRFCSYCGFKLGVVKASLADDNDVPAMDHFTIQVIPKERQKDINLGVILMFVGALIAAFLAGRDFGREGGALILVASFSAILLLARPILKLIYKLLSWEQPPDAFSVSQRRMIFGSILMFTSTILLAITSLLQLGRMRTPEFFVGLLVVFALILAFSKHIMRAIGYLVAGDANSQVLSGTDVTNDPASVGTAAGSPALSAGHEVPVSLFVSHRVKTAEILSPPSITENTTNLLDEK